MAKKKETGSRKTPVKNEQKTVTIELRDLYAFEPKDLTIDITTTRYSNVAYITCEHRDVFIDFLEMPGIKKDGKVMVNGTRIFMSHAAAQKLSEALKEILMQVHEKGKMEMYSPTPAVPAKLSTKVSRSQEEKTG
jgi:hypothetical protein